MTDHAHATNVIMLFLMAAALGACQRATTETSHLAKKKECAELGQKFYEKQRRDIEQVGSTLGQPEFAYNTKLDTCLCYYQVHNASPMARQEQAFVHDVLTNKDLAWFGEIHTTDGRHNVFSTMDYSTFTQRRRELMGSAD